MSEHVLDRPEDHPAGPLPPLLRTGFSAEADRQDGRVVLRLHGELDMATAPRLQRDLDAALDARPAGIALNLQELTFMDSSGIRVLLSAARRASEAGCPLVLRNPCRSVRKALRLTGADQLMAIEPDP